MRERKNGAAGYFYNDRGGKNGSVGSEKTKGRRDKDRNS